MKFNEIQQKLNAPKNLFNKFGNYSYRSCESILEAVKPLLGDAILTISDDIIEVGGRIYVKATARFIDGDFKIENTAFAREEETKKGMDSSQITGSASSYARKYALNGLFLIDDVKDADTMDNTYEKDAKSEKTAKTKSLNKGVATGEYVEPAKKPLLDRYTSALEYLKTQSKLEKRSVIDSVNDLLKDLQFANKIDEYDTLMVEYTRLTKIDDEIVY